MSTALITGISGFAGAHLTRLLLARGFDVVGLAREPARLKGARELADAVRRGDIRLVAADVTDLDGLTSAIAEARADGVFHLAGMAHVPASGADPTRAFRINALGTVNVLAAVAAAGRSCRTLLVSSASVYGAVGADPIAEDRPFRPLNPYGATKVAAELMAEQWAQRGLDVVRVRPFNHTGPGQQPGFVCPDFARQLVAIQRGEKAPTITVGNLDVVRDFSDVRDVVAGYLAAWERGRSGAVYNIASGVGRSVRDVLGTLIEISGQAVQIEVAPGQVRQGEIPIVVGSTAALRTQTGWQPVVPWRQTLTDVFDDWSTRRENRAVN